VLGPAQLRDAGLAWALDAVALAVLARLRA
jgi:hypothetical protein